MFPHPCTHCGLCCLAVTCPTGSLLMRHAAPGPCPALEWDEADPTRSRCGLIAHPERHLTPIPLAAARVLDLPQIIGSGAGCCISARVVVNGHAKDFAALPPDLKTTYVHHLRQSLPPLPPS